MSQMFTPFKIGNSELKHRIVLAPLTRMRAPGHMPNSLMEKYYYQRSTDGGLLITEGTFPNESAIAFKNVPGIWSTDQTSAWKPIVQAVHSRKSTFYMQLWHTGRASMFKPVSCTAAPLKAKGSKVPHALTPAQIEQTVLDFQNSSANAKEAGFDGVEIHAANGYLFQQFLDSTINARTDEYGGSYENRCRFLLETVKGALKVFPKGVGVRLSPYSTYNDTNEMDEQLWLHVVRELNKLELSYLHLVEPRVIGGGQEVVTSNSLDSLIKINKLPLILAGGFNSTNYESKKNVAIAFGRYYISNPTLVHKLKNNIELTKYDRSTFYSSGEKGYTTYT
eukprot:NODE_73_length_23464_cov_0.600171.p5 type:complete len:336 gc:universal NODE_73_length_23464_cov_0.600171:1044-2051(+)